MDERRQLIIETTHLVFFGALALVVFLASFFTALLCLYAFRH